MIPIRDINPRHTWPWVNYLFLGGCIVAFVYQLSLGDDVAALVRRDAFVPALLTEALARQDGALALDVLRRIAIATFLHGGWLHVGGNLLYLRVFGDNIEDRFGHLGYAAFYLGAGVAAALGQWWSAPDATVPMIGASGAIAGVLGTYLVLYPRARVLTLFPVFIFLTLLEVPAIAFLGLWALQNLLSGFLAITTDISGGVAWFAHLGGFAFGVVVGLGFRLTHRKRWR
jgi:membrane associated rhomboid family serine protease